jgi:hypothetical protein
VQFPQETRNIMKNTNILRLARAALPLLACGLFVSALPAQGPSGTPKTEGTIKATVGVEAGLFARQMKLIEERRSSWLAKAAQAMPNLSRTMIKPIAVVKAQKDATSFQGWKMVASGKPESVCNKPLRPGDSFILDFGQHFAGQLTFSWTRRCGWPFFLEKCRRSWARPSIRIRAGSRAPGGRTRCSISTTCRKR